MPVAKLSREFYEKFGDKLTDELVNCLNSIETSYRAELKALFETHFRRFEELLERRLAETRGELRTQWRDEMSRLEVKVEQVRSDFHRELGATRTELMRSNAMFWVAVTLAVIGLYFKT